jgi:hypothetical protein
MTARKTIHFIVGTKDELPFAVLVARGDVATSSLDVVAMPAEYRIPGAKSPEERTRDATMYALHSLGFDPATLAAGGFEDPVVLFDALADETTIEDLRQGWAMRLLAPK